MRHWSRCLMWAGVQAARLNLRAMSAEIPQNQIVIETSSSQQTEPLTTRQTTCPVVQHHKENKPSDGQLQMNESDRSHSSQSLTHEAFEQVSDVDRGTCQPAQHLMPQSFLGRSPGQDELLLQLQVKQLQKVLQEQNALISLISPGLIVSPTFLTHLQAQTTSGFPHTIPVNLTENSAALKESSTKPTLFGEVENEPKGTGVTVKRAQSSESRSLSPIKEECTESEELSPFGSRTNVLANPEERPIRPGLRKKQKTFEEFVEEHLKEQPDNQASTKISQTTKKHFLRKGEGISRIGKGNDDSQMIRMRHSVNPQQQKICLNEVHQNGKKKEMLNESRTKQRRHLLPNTRDLKKYDLKEFQRKPLDPQDDNIQKQANIISSADSEVKPLTSSIVDNANSLKNKHSSEVLSIYGKTNESMSPKKALNKYKTAPAQSRDAPERNPSEENVGFKKINDHIVKVNERNGLPANRLHGQSERSNETSKEFNLSNEVTESLALSDSNNSTSSEDGPISQSHRPLPQFPSRHTDHKDESLDLSDDDYASDAPSEIVSRFSEERRSSTPTSSSSRSSSDSELESLQESMTNHFKKTEDQHVSKWTRESAGLRPLCASERLTTETEQHGEEDHRPLTKEDPSETREPEDLRQQIFSLSQKLMEREVHWSHVQSLLQSRVEALTRENQELYSKLKGTERSQPGSYNRCDTSREDTQKTARVRSETPAFNKPSIHKKETLTGHLTNGQSASKAMKMPEHTASSLRKNSACSVDFGNPDNNAMITRGGKESLFYHNVDSSDAQVAPHVRNDQVKEEIRYPDGRVERLFWNGCRVITFRNGTKKEIGVDKSVTVTFFNGDVKRILADGTVMYYYCDAQTTHSTYPSGLVVLQFPNNQREKRHPDGKREIIFPDGTVKILYPDGQEESIFPDGTVVRISKRGEKIVEFTNGQREIHTSQYKRRIYPDGTVKTVYTNGRQETKFSSGRVRIKNNEGFIIIDKK